MLSYISFILFFQCRPWLSNHIRDLLVNLGHGIVYCVLIYGIGLLEVSLRERLDIIQLGTERCYLGKCDWEEIVEVVIDSRS